VKGGGWGSLKLGKRGRVGQPAGQQFDPAIVKTFVEMPENIWTDLRKGIEEQMRRF